MAEKDSKNFSFTGAEVVERVKELIRAGNVRKIIVRKENGDKIIEIPVTAGAVVGGTLTLFAPWLAILGTAAAFVAKVKVEVQRIDEDGDGDGDPN